MLYYLHNAGSFDLGHLVSGFSSQSALYINDNKLVECEKLSTLETDKLFLTRSEITLVASTSTGKTERRR